VMCGAGTFEKPGEPASRHQVKTPCHERTRCRVAHSNSKATTRVVAELGSRIPVASAEVTIDDN